MSSALSQSSFKAETMPKSFSRFTEHVPTDRMLGCKRDHSNTVQQNELKENRWNYIVQHKATMPELEIMLPSDIICYLQL